MQLLFLTNNLPKGTVVILDRLENLQAPLLGEEKLIAKRFKSLKRQREFTAGRAAARRALSMLGISSCPIPVDERGAPIWPSGVTGSISHSSGYCLCVAAKKENVFSLGADIENINRMTKNIAKGICNTLEGYPEISTVIFCAKEAFVKCYYSMYRKIPSLSDIDIRLSENRLTATYKNLTFPGVWEIKSNLALAVIWALHNPQISFSRP